MALSDFQVQRADGSAQLSLRAISASVDKLADDLLAALTALNDSIRQRTQDAGGAVDVGAGSALLADQDKAKQIDALLTQTIQLKQQLITVLETTQGVTQDINGDQAALAQIASQEEVIATQARGLGLAGIAAGPLAAVPPATFGDKIITGLKVIAVITIAAAVLYTAILVGKAVRK